MNLLGGQPITIRDGVMPGQPLRKRGHSFYIQVYE
jgi:hypothetical protein